MHSMDKYIQPKREESVLFLRLIYSSPCVLRELRSRFCPRLHTEDQVVAGRVRLYFAVYLAIIDNH